MDEIKWNEMGTTEHIMTSQTQIIKSSKQRFDFYLFMKVASTKIRVIKLDVLGPIRSILGHC